MFNQSISISSGINNKQKETGSGNLESDCLASQESKAGSALGRRQLSFLLAGRWGDARAGATQTEERPQLLAVSVLGCLECAGEKSLGRWGHGTLFGK